MKKLSDTMKHVTERKEFVKNEELKRIYKEQGVKVPIEEQVYKPHNFLSRETFVNDKELYEKFSKEETDCISGKILILKPLSDEEKCLGFEEFLKNKKN